ncbi:MAG TPA: YeeE/YedE thiosulfate transporter family protein, partial [Myxococcaceae bacterium]|nr:YeeE/YedE thiosulfate transporter family protein [Myxococcaceae bacterium]
MNLALAFAVGLCFGALLQRVGAARHELILGTLRLRDLTILKFMLLAIGVAAVGTGVLAGLGQAHFAIKPAYVAGVLIGGLIFGVGFALSGYCPGTCLVASAEGRRDAWFTVAGGFLGALVYALAFPALKPLLVDRWNLGPMTLGQALHLSPAVLGVV